jgi:hypothetical protein
MIADPTDWAALLEALDGATAPYSLSSQARPTPADSLPPAPRPDLVPVPAGPNTWSLEP